MQVLVDLGLTLLQARVYLALVESGPLRVSAISRISKVARPDVYQTLIKLQQKGLVERLLKTPVAYRAIPMDKGASLLLETKAEQYEKLRAKTETLLDTFKTKKPNDTDRMEDNQFALIPEGKAVVERIRTAIEKAQLSMDLLLSWRRFSRGVTSTFAESIDKAWGKEVKIRFIIESPLESNTANELVQFCREKPFCQIRFVVQCPRTVFGIFDRKEVLIIVNPRSDLPESPALWSNNPSLLAIAEEHFEAMWLGASET